MLVKKRKRTEGEIPAASLADIAFLILIFFLVTTTIDVDTGIGLVLPPPPQKNEQPPPIHKRNMMKILVRSDGSVLVNDKPANIPDIKKEVMDFVDNHGKDPNLSESPDQAVVSIKSDRQTSYNIFVQVMDEVKGAYNQLRDNLSRREYGVPYDMLPNDGEKQGSIKKAYPEKISEAEPDKGNSNS